MYVDASIKVEKADWKWKKGFQIGSIREKLGEGRCPRD